MVKVNEGKGRESILHISSPLSSLSNLFWGRRYRPFRSAPTIFLFFFSTLAIESLDVVIFMASLRTPHYAVPCALVAEQADAKKPSYKLHEPTHPLQESSSKRNVSTGVQRALQKERQENQNDCRKGRSTTTPVILPKEYCIFRFSQTVTPPFRRSPDPKLKDVWRA